MYNYQVYAHRLTRYRMYGDILQYVTVLRRDVTRSASLHSQRLNLRGTIKLDGHPFRGPPWKASISVEQTERQIGAVTKVTIDEKKSLSIVGTTATIR